MQTLFSPPLGGTEVAPPSSMAVALRPLCVLLVAGCGAAAPTSAPLQTAAAESTPCYNNIDCPRELGCVSGSCKPLSCESDWDCAAHGMACDLGQCFCISECESSADCPGTDECVGYKDQSGCGRRCGGADACVGHCFNGVVDCGETGADCGGDCTACDPCTGGSHCGDSVKNCGEAEIDCGGTCGSCDACADHCGDGYRNCGETSVDCGGFCGPC